MADSSDPRDKPHRYQHLFYEGRPSVLVNKLDIRDQAKLTKLEKEGLRLAYARLQAGEFQLRGPLNANFILKLHGLIFGRIYEWAGRPRGINLAPWSPPQFIEHSLLALERNYLAKHPPAQLRSDEQFCQAAAEIHGEFIPVHPFLDGNGRTIRLAIDVLAHASGRPILQYDRSEAGKEHYLQASSDAFHRQDYRPLATILRESLTRARDLRIDIASTPGDVIEQNLDRALDDLSAANQKRAPQLQPPIRRKR